MLRESYAIALACSTVIYVYFVFCFDIVVSTHPALHILAFFILPLFGALLWSFINLSKNLYNFLIFGKSEIPKPKMISGNDYLNDLNEQELEKLISKLEKIKKNKFNYTCYSDLLWKNNSN